jgi:molybdopterin molybdotransferase
LTANIPSTYGIEEYVRVRVERREGLTPLVTPIFAKSSVISNLAKADGYVVVPEGQEGIEVGVEVEVLPLG